MTADIRSWLGGRYTDSAAARYQVRSPVDGEVVAEVHRAGPDTVDEAVRAASAAVVADRRSSPYARRDRCLAIADRFLARREEIAALVTAETGRIYQGTLAEVDKAADGFRLAGEEAVRLAGRTLPVAATDKLVMTRWRPTGVWAVVTPWNFPVNIPVEYLGPLVATGNAAVWKPAPTTVASADLVLRCMVEAGLPEGQVTLVATDDTAVAGHLVGHPQVVGVGLTGSTATGEAVSRRAAGKRLLLELGGNGPIIVFADADLMHAAEAIALSCFTASGQVCSAGGRILADSRIAGPLAEAVAARAGDYPTGDPYQPATVLGPVHLPALATRFEEQVTAATRDGARVLTGGRHLPDFPTGQYLPATVVGDVAVEAALSRQESFAPVAPIVPLPASELVAEANRSGYGLSTAVFTADLGRAMDALDDLEFGSVVVNDRSTYWELHLPFGGWEGKDSGTGRVGVPAVVRAVCQQQTLSLSRP
ncbi:aldehyde dehydrogenase family protein [Micromonospora craniellae]|uniref:aldehyde dehydrogenase family protein n=1 Tax=Micromonospora craniellae TaxID=2294034 RepID=UPI001314229A|nr:aldehyde dehydrogenase family protein [Micromonospora craniellae]QOC91273.1 aldehyde dehydrogenase [Micromonospora craniellae]